MNKAARYLIPLLAILCLWPAVSSALALIMGLVAAVALGNPYLSRTRKLTSQLLSIAVMGLGAGMNLAVVGRVGLHGVGYTALGITLTLLLGTFLGRRLATSPDTSTLITVGTAICGGSAIAAVAPVIRAKSDEISVALGVVFLLNALALVIFPMIGHAIHLTQPQFGLWSALAIHDTSSVVGANLQYGAQALEIGTTVKLARALWIVPLTFGVGFVYARKSQRASTPADKPKRPWFILGFLAAAALATYVPALAQPAHWVDSAAKRLLVLTLFLIGTNLTLSTIRAVGLRPLVQGIALWLIVASATLGGVLTGLIRL